MKQSNRVRAFLRDTVKSVGIGFAVAAGVFVLLFVAGLLTHGFSLLAGLELARRGLFIVGALALLVSAGALLLPEKAASLSAGERWQTRFGTLGLFGVLFFAAVTILLAASLLDAWLFYRLL